MLRTYCCFCYFSCKFMPQLGGQLKSFPSLFAPGTLKTTTLKMRKIFIRSLLFPQADQHRSRLVVHRRKSRAELAEELFPLKEVVGSPSNQAAHLNKATQRHGRSLSLGSNDSTFSTLQTAAEPKVRVRAGDGGT